jgi:Xaa-Pro aminopeptidase
VERPLIRSDETLRLERGMNVAVHPGCATATMFVVIGDNYLIEDNGAGECLHQTPKRVFELT